MPCGGGAIVGKCAICWDWIYEGDWDLTRSGTMIHTDCKGKRVKSRPTPEHILGHRQLDALEAAGYVVIRRKEMEERT